MRSSALKVSAECCGIHPVLGCLLAATGVAWCSDNPPPPSKAAPTTAVAKALRIGDPDSHDEVIKQTSAMIRDDPTDGIAYRKRAQAYWYKGMYAKAIADADRAIALSPNDAEAYFIRGNALSDTNECQRALQDYNQSLQIAPNQASVLLNRGLLYESLKQYDKALKDYNRALRIDPQEVGGYVNRGHLHKQMKEYDKAIKDFQAALRLAPDHHLPYTNLAWLLATCPKAEIRDGRKAVQYARKACELSAWGDTNDLENLAAAYAETGQYREAVKWQKKALERPDRFTKAGLEGAQERLKLYEQGKPYRDNSFPAVIEKR